MSAHKARDRRRRHRANKRRERLARRRRRWQPEAVSCGDIILVVDTEGYRACADRAQGSGW